MSRFDALFEAIVGSFCGACANGTACEKCLGSTLKANGFDDNESNRARIRGKKNSNSSYEWGWGFSEMAKELKNMRAEQEKTNG